MAKSNKNKKHLPIPEKANILVTIVTTDKKVVTGFISPVYYLHQNLIQKKYRFYELKTFAANEAILIQDPNEIEHILTLAQNNTIEIENVQGTIVFANVYEF